MAILCCSPAVVYCHYLYCIIFDLELEIQIRCGVNFSMEDTNCKLPKEGCCSTSILEFEVNGGKVVIPKPTVESMIFLDDLINSDLVMVLSHILDFLSSTFYAL